MGDDKYTSENPAHYVDNDKDLYLGKCEVTQKQWIYVMGSDGTFNIVVILTLWIMFVGLIWWLSKQN